MTEHIKAGSKLCKELQGGHDSYFDGLLLADSHTINDGGDWLVTHNGRLANVHPIQTQWGTDAIQQHNGKNVYGIRFWL